VTGLRVGSATDTGQVRTQNEDAALIGDVVFAVADGMGGHAAGEVASQVAVEAFGTSTSGGVEDEEDLVEAVRAANQAVLDRADDEPELAGMGTTLTALALVPAPADGTGPSSLVIANVGDSRAYLFRDGDLTQLTRDHSLVEDLVQEGRLSPEEARTHPQRNILTRVLGNDPDIEPDVFRADPVRGDRYLLCSDGLSNEVDDERAAAVLRRLADPDDAARELVRLANENGGRDNITVVVVDVVDDDGRARTASRLLGRGRRSTDATGAGGAPTAVLERVEEEAPEGGGPPKRADVKAERAERRATRKAVRKARPRRVTFRSLLFVLLVLAVGAAAVGAVWWFARNTFYVGVDGEEVVIFRGRPGGVLWVEPTVEQRTDLLLARVPAERQQDVEKGRTEPTLEDARDYVRALRERVQELEDARARREAANAATSTTAPPGGGG
jgi:serine/threonine protein phosphatase PrpC